MAAHSYLATIALKAIACADRVVVVLTNVTTGLNVLLFRKAVYQLETIVWILFL